jgi:hypothetical protein
VTGPALRLAVASALDVALPVGRTSAVAVDPDGRRVEIVPGEGRDGT